MKTKGVFVILMMASILLSGCKKSTQSGDTGVPGYPVKYIIVLDGKMEPSDATFIKGTYVTFSNTSSNSHTLLSTDSTINSGTILPASFYTVQFLNVGNYSYRCTDHNVSGVIHIQ